MQTSHRTREGVLLYGVRIWNSSRFPKKMRMGTQNNTEHQEPRDPELPIAWFTIQNWISVFSMLLLFTLYQALRGGQTKTCGDTQETRPLAVGSSLGEYLPSVCEALGSTPRTVKTESCSCHSMRASLWGCGPSRSKGTTSSCLLWSFLVSSERQFRRGTSVSFEDQRC